jgi:hypothetical protein
VHVNELISESNEQIALKLSKMNQVIEDQKVEIAKRDKQLKQFKV